ncbi:hypothetical protein O6H91_07G025900 [Diphasiastrum complanatum]|uniref:Uncharacterized protein n=1 Tax=Diphasiastrum complanatum TaxID=34168 RepID=A0ACC2D3F1_DIPCM|nr:hypothetical protein O6H91_07G025900 [Diphasiastrum complanatum]
MPWAERNTHLCHSMPKFLSRDRIERLEEVPKGTAIQILSMIGALLDGYLQSKQVIYRGISCTKSFPAKFALHNGAPQLSKGMASYDGVVVHGIIFAGCLRIEAQ